MTRFLLALAASALVIVCGVVHGYWTDRWQQQPAETAAAAARMDALPLHIDDWSGEALTVKDPRAAGVAATSPLWPAPTITASNCACSVVRPIRYLSTGRYEGAARNREHLGVGLRGAVLRAAACG